MTGPNRFMIWPVDPGYDESDAVEVRTWFDSPDDAAEVWAEGPGRSWFEDLALPMVVVVRRPDGVVVKVAIEPEYSLNFYCSEIE